MNRRAWLAAAMLLALAGATAVVVAAFPGRAAVLDVASVPEWGWRRHIMSIAGAVCLGAVPGLARGRRVAWWIGFGALGATALAGLVNDAELTLLAPAALAAATLLWSRRHFSGRADARLVQSGLLWLVAGEAMVFLYGAIGLYLLDANFTEPTDLLQSVQEGVRLVFLLPASAFTPASAHGTWFLDSVRWLSFVVLAGSALRLLAPSSARPDGRANRERVTRILESWATTSVAPFHLLSDKHWCFSPDREAFVGYALVGRRAVALGGPVGAPDARLPALDAFLALCARNGWAPCVHQADDADAALLTGRGFKLLRIGDEAVVDLGSFTLSGRAGKSLRSSTNMATRAGLTTGLLTTPIDGQTMSALRRVSNRWLAESGHRERGFSLGRFDPDALRNAPVVVVRDTVGGIVAFANIIPSYRSAVGNFDLMRRLPDAPRGTMELLFVAMIDHFRSRGRTGMSLGLAPLANLGDGTVMERLLGAVRDHAGRAFNFIGLYDFKSKWRPRWEPRYLAYPGATQLPQAALAVIRAGELTSRARAEARIRHLVRVNPLAVALTATVLWLMAATRNDPGFHSSLLQRLGLSWSDLTRGEVWRVPTSAILPGDPGYTWTVIVLLGFVWVAERRLGTRVVLLCYFAFDAIASLVTVLGSRIAAASGNAEALASLTERDSGPSAAAIGLAALLIHTLPSHRSQALAQGGLAIALVTGLTIDPSRTSIEHLIAAVAGLALGHVFARRHATDPTSASEAPSAPRADPGGA